MFWFFELKLFPILGSIQLLILSRPYNMNVVTNDFITEILDSWILFPQFFSPITLWVYRNYVNFKAPFEEQTFKINMFNIRYFNNIKFNSRDLNTSYLVGTLHLIKNLRAVFRLLK